MARNEKNLTDWRSLSNINPRQYFLIHFITYQLLISSIIIISFYVFGELYYLVSVVSTAGLLAFLNLCLLIRTRNTFLCGHILILILFLTVLIANYFVRGINASFSAWFYVLPVLGLTLAGSFGLMLYSTLSLLVIIMCKIVVIPAYYPLSVKEIVMIGWINHLMAFVIIMSTLYSLMRANKRYEQALHHKNDTLKLEKEKYHYLSCFDELTNLPNRHYFKFNLERAIESLLSYQCITLFFMDLDNLKYINDSLGHDAGDHLLLETAQRLKICFRKEDFIARLGGDEFIAFMIHPKSRNISKVIIKRIKRSFKKTIQYQKKIYSSSISIGLATYPEQATTLNELMNLADKAMYHQKNKEKKISSSAPIKSNFDNTPPQNLN